MDLVSSLMLDYISFEAVFKYIKNVCIQLILFIHGIYLIIGIRRIEMRVNFPNPPSFSRFTGLSARDLSFNIQIPFCILHCIISAYDAMP
jgi:hypothetical protein